MILTTGREKVVSEGSRLELTPWQAVAAAGGEAGGLIMGLIRVAKLGCRFMRSGGRKWP